MGKKSRSGSGLNIPDHIFESLETILWVKILKYFDADANPDPGSGNRNFDPGYIEDLGKIAACLQILQFSLLILNDFKSLHLRI
jgi:hypothetical protein